MAVKIHLIKKNLVNNDSVSSDKSVERLPEPLVDTESVPNLETSKTKLQDSINIDVPAELPLPVRSRSGRTVKFNHNPEFQYY